MAGLCQLTVIFVSKAGVYPSEAPRGRLLALPANNTLVRPTRDKILQLFGPFVSFRRKNANKTPDG